jgi:hypothetical protein
MIYAKGVKRMRKDENWAVDISRIREFFREQADVHEENGCFIFGECIITLISQTGNAFEKWKIPRTQIIFEGNQADLENIHRRFFLRFLSAGG